MRLWSVVSVASLSALAGSFASARAATTSLVWEASVNGGPFAASVTASPSDFVRFRLRVSLSGNSGAGSVGGVGGFAGVSLTPTLTNFDVADQTTPLLAEQWPKGADENPFSGVIVHPDLGTITNVYTGPLPVPAGTLHGPGAVNSFGRQAPWGSSGVSGNGLPRPSVASGVLSWTAVSGGGTRVSLDQLPADFCNVNAITGVDDAGTPGDPSDDALISSLLGNYHNSSRTNVVPFMYEIKIGGFGPRVLTQSAIVQSGQGGGWYINSSGVNARFVPVAVQSATVTVVIPAPGTLVIGVWGLAAFRRRR